MLEESEESLQATTTNSCEADEEDSSDEEALSDYDLSCAGFIKRKIKVLSVACLWAFLSAGFISSALFSSNQLSGTISSFYLALFCGCSLFIFSVIGLIVKQLQNGHLLTLFRYYWKPLLVFSVFQTGSLLLLLHSTQGSSAPITDLVSIHYSFAGIMALPLCCILHVTCTKWGILALPLTMANLFLLYRPKFLTDIEQLHIRNSSLSNPVFAEVASSAIFQAIATTIILWRLSVLNLFIVTFILSLCMILAASPFIAGLKIALTLNGLPKEIILFIFSSTVFYAIGIAILVYWLKCERSRVFLVFHSCTPLLVMLLSLIVFGQRPDWLTVVSSCLIIATTALVSLGQMKYESWLLYQEERSGEYSRLTILPNSPFEMDSYEHIENGNSNHEEVETCFNSVTAREETHELESVNLESEDERNTAWSPLKLINKRK